MDSFNNLFNPYTYKIKINGKITASERLITDWFGDVCCYNKLLFLWQPGMRNLTLLV